MVTSNINEALAALQMDLPRITKDHTAEVKSERTGARYTYSYADLAQVSAEVLPRLGKLGLSFTSRPTMVDGKFVLVYELRHVSGESIDGVYPLPERGTPQEVGGAITYARRYCLCAVTGVAAEGDDKDAEKAERSAKRSQRQSGQEQNGGEPPITAEQQRRMQKAFRDLEISDRNEKLQYAIKVVGRQVSSATELTQIEAGKVIKEAEREAAKRVKEVVAPESGEWPAVTEPADA
jgi:hypothetical protein